MDFVSDALFDGRRFRSLTIVDNFSRECLAIHADQSLKGGDVRNVVERIWARIGQSPDRIQVDYIRRRIRFSEPPPHAHQAAFVGPERVRFVLQKARRRHVRGAHPLARRRAHVAQTHAHAGRRGPAVGALQKAIRSARKSGLNA